MERDAAIPFSYTSPPSFLGAWTNLFKSFRTTTLVTGSYPTTLLTADNYMSSPIIQYHFPGLIFLGVLFVFMILLVISSCFMCCNSCCCKARLGKKYAKMNPPSSLKKACAFASLIIPSALSGICIYIHLAGSNNFSTGLAVSKNAVVNVLIDVDNFFIELAPNFGTTLDTLGGNINSSIDGLISSVNFAEFNNYVQPAFGIIISTMFSIEYSKESIITLYPGIVINTDYLQKNASILKSLIANISAAVSQLSSLNNFTINPYKLDRWKLTNPVSSSLDADSVKSSADNSPNTASIFGSLQSSANLTASGISIQEKINNGVTSAQDSVTNTSTSLKSTIHSTLNDVKKPITQTVSNFSTQIGVDTYINQVNSQWTTVSNYDNIRGYGQIGLVCLYILPVLLISIGGATRSPGLMKGINLTFAPYFVLLFFFSILIFMMTLLFGDACYLIFDAEPSPLGPLLSSVTGVSQLANTTTSVGNIFHSCTTGSSLLDVVSKFGLNTSSFNFTSIANDQINSFNLSSASSVDLSSVVSLSSNPTNDANSTNVDLSTLTVAPFAKVITQTNTLKANLTTLGSQLSSLLGINGTLSGYNVSDNAQNTQAYLEFETNVNAILGNISYAYQIINLMQSLSNNLTTSITSVNSTAISMLSNISSISPLYNTAMGKFNDFAGSATSNLTNAIPTLKDNLLKAAITVSANINTALGCQQIGTDFNKFRQGFCGDTMAGLDSFWSTLTIMALCGLVSLPLTVFGANTLFLDLTRYQRQYDPEYEERDDDIEKGKKDDQKGGKNVVSAEYVPMNVIKTQEVFSPINSPILAQPEDEDDESGDDDEEKNIEIKNEDFLVEIDKNFAESDDQQEFESRQANISIQSDLLQFSPVTQKIITVEPVYENDDAADVAATNNYNTERENVSITNRISASAPLPTYNIFNNVPGDALAESVVKSNTIKSNHVLSGAPYNTEEAGAPSAPLMTNSVADTSNPYLERLQTPENKRKKNTLDLDSIQARSFTHSHQAYFGTTSHRKQHSDLNRDHSSNSLSVDGEPQTDTHVVQVQTSNLQAEVQHMKESLPLDQDVPISQPVTTTESQIRGVGSQQVQPESLHGENLSKSSPGDTPEEPSPLGKNSLPSLLLTDIANPSTAKRLSSFSPEMYSPPKITPVEKGTKPSVPYDDLRTLADRFKLPELLKAAELVTVDQVAVMDVIEAEGFGISRDAYFKLKRYFISRRKYV